MAQDLSGTYRVAMPYAVVKGKKRIQAEAVSEPFELRYGDVKPQGWSKKSVPGHLVFLGFETEPVDEKGTRTHTAPQLASLLMEGIGKCVSGTQKTVPWIRGGFTLVVYRYPSEGEVTTFVQSSLLGDAKLEACIRDVPAPAGLVGRHDLNFAVTHPLIPVAMTP